MVARRRPGRSIKLAAPEVPLPRLLSIALLACLVGCATTAASVDATAPKASSSTAPHDTSGTLFERLGGLPAVTAVTDALLQRMFADEQLAWVWAGSNLPLARQHLVEFLCAATGGGCAYTGRDMVEVHRGLGISDAQFDRLLGYLSDILDGAKVAAGDKAEVMKAVEGTRRTVVMETP